MHKLKNLTKIFIYTSFDCKNTIFSQKKHSFSKKTFLILRKIVFLYIFAAGNQFFISKIFFILIIIYNQT
ncbi:conserved domain protein [Paraprevotella xylaniphila YIT 11841]|uniref:Conserved domain protein n=1 Tax=Paraprevotella xylaniphila YIT 11841 TaxID=762982 RepID=F3QTD2_9BACT|nr:conserved domain protein [Paraprevotella xylaniphila YIT 11841]